MLLAVNSHQVVLGRGVVSLILDALHSGEIEHGNTSSGIGGEDSVFAGDVPESRRERTAGRCLDGGEVGRECTVLLNIPNSKETGGVGRRALDGGDQLVVGFVEHDGASSVRGTLSRGGLVEVQRPLGVLDSRETLILGLEAAIDRV